MVDIFALALPHALLVLALWRIVLRDDLDFEGEDGSNGEGRPPRPGQRDRTLRGPVQRGVRVHD